MPKRPLRSPKIKVVPPRRVPTQERSKQRLERILDTADQVFAEVGYQAATMEDIAERAGTSIGSLYQFFPNKKSLFDALTARYFERARELFEQLLASGALDRPWPEILDTVIDAFWRYNADTPGFRALWAQQSIPAELIVASDIVNRAIASRTEQVIEMFAPQVSATKRALVATLLVETVSSSIFLAARRQEPEASGIIEETKALLRAYCATFMGTA